MNVKGPFLEWMNNGLNKVAPPADASEWVRVIATVSRLLIVWLVSNERGGWRLAKAEDPPPMGIGSGPYQTQPVDRTSEVRQALLAAGKPVE